MSGATTTEKVTGSLPGGENLHHERETALHRAYEYPLVKDTLSYTHSVLESYPLTSNLYHRVASLTQFILSRLEPLQKRFEQPLATADGYANATLDYIEKKVPQVKMETGELIGRAKQPADQAYQVAQEYKNGIQQRVSPITDQFAQRLEQGSKTLTGLQDRLKSLVPAVGDIPHDSPSLQKTLHSISTELDQLSKTAKSLPANAQAAAKPIVDGVFQAAQDVQKELQRDDIPLGAKAANVLAYSQDRISPILVQVVDYVKGKKGEAEDKATEMTSSN
jgi:DNA repair ATPase RecN